MSFYHQTSHDKFLQVFGGPFEGFLCGCTLKTGFWCLSIISLFGLLEGAYMMVLQMGLVLITFDTAFVDPLLLLGNLACIILGVSAAYGLRGLYQLDPDLIKQNYFINLVMIPITAVIWLFILLPTASTEEYLAMQVFGCVIGVCGVIILGLICSKLIWSIMVRIRNNEATLVMYGKDAAELVAHQQSILENPVPGRPNLELVKPH